MNFNIFEHHFSKIKNLPLPGETSHYKMVPKTRLRDLQGQNTKYTSAKKAGVLALFYPDANEQTNLLCILRKTYNGVHSNQVGFPGGKVEQEDTTILAAALRETHEEVGVAPADVKIVKTLTQVFIPVSDFMVHPFLGLVRYPKPFVREEMEVAKIIEVALDEFLLDSNVISKNIITSQQEEMVVPAYQLNGYTVWGATAMIMSEIKALLKQIL